MNTRGTLRWFMVMMAAVSLSARAQGSGTGVGVLFGDPTGLSLKHWVGTNTAFDAGVAWDTSGRDVFQFHADYLMHNSSVLRPDMQPRGALYFGLGARLRIEEDQGRRHDDNEAEFGIRIPVGLSYFVASAPLEIFAEVVPILDLTPDTEVDLNAGIGVRFYFR